MNVEMHLAFKCLILYRIAIFSLVLFLLYAFMCIMQII
jgi:hypothetical protein